MEFRFTEPATDYRNGLRVLRAYHEAFIKQGEQLLSLAIHIQHRGVDEKSAYQCVAHYSYFSRANPLHHRDEEHSLFPLLLEKSLLLDAMLERLTLDHEEIEQCWDELAAALRNPESIQDRDRFMELTYVFERLQREHLIRENEDLFPLVEEQLSPAQLAAAGAKMAKFRGLYQAARGNAAGGRDAQGGPAGAR